jgi:hypothetical protein
MVNKQGEMKMKDLAYYTTVPLALPSATDFKKVYVYKRGKVVIDGKPYEEVKDQFGSFRADGCTIETEEDKEGYRAARAKYNQARQALTEEFKRDLFAENGVAGHPKAEEAYSIAYNERSNGGFQEIMDLFEDIAALLR